MVSLHIFHNQIWSLIDRTGQGSHFLTGRLKTFSQAGFLVAWRIHKTFLKSSFSSRSAKISLLNSYTLGLAHPYTIPTLIATRKLLYNANSWQAENSAYDLKTERGEMSTYPKTIISVLFYSFHQNMCYVGLPFNNVTTTICNMIVFKDLKEIH